jgi:hypothetical protein
VQRRIFVLHRFQSILGQMILRPEFLLEFLA